MARIAGVDIPNNKRTVIALTYIYGIGNSTAEKILKDTGVNGDIRVKDLTEEQLNALRKAVDQIKVEGDLRREKQSVLKLRTSSNCYRGQRHRRGLPVRGQRTRTNARTRKGKKKTVGAQAKKK